MDYDDIKAIADLITEDPGANSGLRKDVSFGLSDFNPSSNRSRRYYTDDTSDDMSNDIPSLQHHMPNPLLTRYGKPVKSVTLLETKGYRQANIGRKSMPASPPSQLPKPKPTFGSNSGRILEI